MADIHKLITDARDAGYFEMMTRNPFAQFGPPSVSYLGPTLLPNMMVDENAYREDQVKFRTVIAGSGTRYSPTQKRAGDLYGYFDVRLVESDISREMTGRQYDGLLKMLMADSNPSMGAMGALISWADITLNRALIDRAEADRWQAIVNSAVVREGDNNYNETVTYDDPTGHRVNAGGTWSNDSYDPYEDIFGLADFMRGKGFEVNRIITSTKVASIMANNAIVRTRTSRVSVTPAGNIETTPGRSTFPSINDHLNADGLPGLELYDYRYRTESEAIRFIPDDVMILIATTGRDQTLVRPETDEQIPLQDTLGYYAIGRAAGQAEPGPVIRVEPKEDKPPRILGEAWMTSLPVILEPEAICVIKNIA
jgi:hypothetical protein